LFDRVIQTSGDSASSHHALTDADRAASAVDPCRDLGSGDRQIRLSGTPVFIDLNRSFKAAEKHN
jgi:hypothetical protein